jgi:hypothetical protein
VHRSSKLGARLAANGIEARLFLVSGAALALAFGRRRITRDLDAVFEPICAAWVTEDPRPELRIGGRVPYTRPTGDTGVVFIDTAPEDAATGPLADYYRQQRAAWGFLPNYAAAFSTRPDVAQGWNTLNTTIRRCRAEWGGAEPARARGVSVRRQGRPPTPHRSRATGRSDR